MDLPFIINDGVGAAESSYCRMAWFARPSFRHLDRGRRHGLFITRFRPFGTCQILQVTDFSQML
ncbi:hypothetical protein ASE98_08880 [Pseudomonas sp. Leaf48]|nr:hypothetical protein ASE98_08880 [Pseudomonas sp. Leaf48]